MVELELIFMVSSFASSLEEQQKKIDVKEMA